MGLNAFLCTPPFASIPAFIVHTLILTAKIRSAMSQNLTTVSDIANTITHQQQCSGLSTTDPLLKTRSEVHSLYSIVQGETPREVIKLD